MCMCMRLRHLAQAVIEGVRFFGSPYQPIIPAHRMAFEYPASQAQQTWSSVPEGVDVLVTHGPPKGIQDRTFVGTRCVWVGQRGTVFNTCAARWVVSVIVDLCAWVSRWALIKAIHALLCVVLVLPQLWMCCVVGHCETSEATVPRVWSRSSLCGLRGSFSSSLFFFCCPPSHT